MASFTAEKRTKEIGIRKVLGANQQNIFMLLSKQILILIIFASIIATPVAWMIMSEWLNNFAHRIDIAPWMFLAGIISAFLIAFITVSFQALKAVTANPVKSLKYE